jgi:hypothetical protein
MTRRSNRWRPTHLSVLLLVVALAAVSIAHTLLWRSAEQELEAGFAAWIADRRAEGWSVSAGPLTHGGWPLSARLTVPDLSMIDGKEDIPQGIAWKADRLVLNVALLQPRLLVIAPQRMQRLHLGNEAEIRFMADKFDAVIQLDRDVPPHTIDVAATNLRVGLPASEGPASDLMVAGLTLRAEMRPTAPRGEAVLAATLTALDIALPPAPHEMAWALGPRIASLIVDAALNGPLPQGPGLKARANVWRDRGGTLQLHRIALAWGPLGLAGHATLALDESLQPMGTSTLRLVGESETLDALAAAHVLAPHVATAVKAILSLMAKAPEDSGTAGVEVPLTLQNHTLAMGRIPLARTPELVWPPGPQ